MLIFELNFECLLKSRGTKDRQPLGSRMASVAWWHLVESWFIKLSWTHRESQLISAALVYKAPKLASNQKSSPFDQKTLIFLQSWHMIFWTHPNFHVLWWSTSHYVLDPHSPFCGSPSTSVIVGFLFLCFSGIHSKPYCFGHIVRPFVCQVWTD